MKINNFDSLNPLRILGCWDQGYTLDEHVISSILIGENEYGYMQYDNTRSKLGEAIYQFKYRNKYDTLSEIIEIIKPFLSWWSALKSVDAVLPAPSSNKSREYQPVQEIARKIAEFLGVDFFGDVLHKTSSVQSKEMNAEEKKQIIGTIIETKQGIKKRNVLLIDDLFQTGTTLNECSHVLRQDKSIDKIYVLAMTRTKGKQK